jgi:hypothetical protein
MPPFSSKPGSPCPARAKIVLYIRHIMSRNIFFARLWDRPVAPAARSLAGASMPHSDAADPHFPTKMQPRPSGRPTPDPVHRSPARAGHGQASTKRHILPARGRFGGRVDGPRRVCTCRGRLCCRLERSGVVPGPGWGCRRADCPGDLHLFCRFRPYTWLDPRDTPLVLVHFSQTSMMDGSLHLSCACAVSSSPGLSTCSNVPGKL